MLHELEVGDAEAVEPLVNQRDALALSRERMQLIGSRRDDAAAQLETLWADVRRLSGTTEASASRELATKISGLCAAVERRYPARRTSTTSQRTTASRLGVIFAVSAVVMARQDAASAGDARALLARGQPDSALVLLSAAGNSDMALTALRRYAALMPTDRAALYSLGQLGAIHGVGLAEAEVALRTYWRPKGRAQDLGSWLEAARNASGACRNRARSRLFRTCFQVTSRVACSRI